jgi:hypothetical protein
MGMYDSIRIDNKWLPKDLKGHNTGWQTKSLDCSLSEYIMMEDGSLVYYASMDEVYNRNTSYTGEIRFYNEVDGKYRYFVAWCVRGTVKEVIEII